MEPRTVPAASDASTLDAVLANLAVHREVVGIALLGSTRTAAATPFSDIDLLLVLDRDEPPFRLMTTWIEGKLAEIQCTTVGAAERVVSRRDGWPSGGEEASLLTRLRDGRVVHDSDGRLATLQVHARRLPTPTPDQRARYEAWRTIGYNAAQLQRYPADPDPDAGFAADLRLLYSVFEVALHYFTVRRLTWQGEKAAVRYWSKHDPEFSDVFQRCLTEPDRRTRAMHYQSLANRALAPMGGIWSPGTTTVSLGPRWAATDHAESVGSVDEALAYWATLVGPLDRGP